MVEQKEGYKIVTPGTLLATTPKKGKGIWVYERKTYSKYYGILKRRGELIEIQPINMKYYMPKRGDYVIGIIKDNILNFYIVDISSPYPGYLYYFDLTKNAYELEYVQRFYKIGTVIYSQVYQVGERVKLTMKDSNTKILRGGRLIKIAPSKIPRVIGRNASMISMIQKMTNCKIAVGYNGIIWVSGENMDLVVEAINKIERESLIPGLTDRIKEFLENRLKEKSGA